MFWGITAINIPAGVETVGSRAFAGCEAITELTFRSGTTVISDEAFTLCKGITEVSFPKNVVKYWRGCVFRLHGACKCIHSKEYH